MFLHLTYWIVTLGVLLVLPIIVMLIVRIAKTKVWIKTKIKSGAGMREIGYLVPGDEETASEVKLSGSGRKPSVGRVQAEVQGIKARGNVDVLVSDWSDEGSRAEYRHAGYISFGDDTVVDRYGYIYREEKGKKKELVGYCARPSDPETPTVHGERTWRSLWLKCTLNAYFGRPVAAKAEGPNLPPTERIMTINDEQPSEQSGETPVEPVIPTTENTEPINPAPEEPKPEESEAKRSETKKDKKEAKSKKAKKEKKSKKAKKSKREPDAMCYYKGFRHKDVLPPEARACAYALLAKGYEQRSYSESFASRPYGWGDTALLTSVVYTLLYLLLYTFNTAILGLPLLGNDMRAVSILTAAYFALWALIRMIKVESIENSNTFQPKLDLFNKNLGLRWFNIAILALASLSGTWSYFYYDMDFIPLATAIATGVTVNMTLKGANKRWRISSTYGEENGEWRSENEESGEEKNPEGDIARSYEWLLDSPNLRAGEVKGSLTLYFSARRMEDIRYCNPFFAQRKERSDKEYIAKMFNYIGEHRDLNARVQYAAHSIARQATRAQLTPMERIQFALDFVQEPNIKFVRNSECKNINYYDDYIRYPDETLYDKEGEWNSKSLLALMLMHEMGYNTLYMFSRRFDHAGIGIELKAYEVEQGWYGDVEELTLEYEGRRYLYCETTGDRFRIGGTIDGMHIEDFDDILPLPAQARNIEGSETRIYNWDLDSPTGATRHGTLTLTFDTVTLTSLRAANPFLSYGQDSSSYEQNVRTAFDYLKEDSARMAHVQAVADYITKECADLSTLDQVQFALDFAQEPNITYRVDEESESIEYAKEYMRFPDEVLYDKEGDCDCKSSLTAALYLAMGYKVLFMLSKKLKHAAIAIELKDPSWLDIIKPEKEEAVVREVNGVRYLYCETTSDGHRVGRISQDNSIHDFETYVELESVMS